VGSILVIAMLIAPAATARLLTDRLRSQLVVSLVAATLSGVGGYIAATGIPAAVDADSVNAAGSMTVAAGVLVVVVAFASPSHGLIARTWRQRRLAREAAVDDLLAALWRMQEAGRTPIDPEDITTRSVFDLQRALRLARGRTLVRVDDTGRLTLTEAGATRARRQVRRHREWETYLADTVGLDPQAVHDHAEQFEHLPIDPDSGRRVDPHGRPIPPEPDPPPPDPGRDRQRS